MYLLVLLLCVDASLLGKFCSVRSKKALKTLLLSGADPNVPFGRPSRLPLEWACQLGNFQAAKLLLEFGALPDCHDPSTGASCLSRACRRGQLELVRLLLEHGADPDMADQHDGDVPILGAARWDRWEIVRLLLAHGADPSVKSMTDGKGLLHLACASDRLDLILRLAAECGEDLMEPDEQGYTCFQLASRRTRKILKAALDGYDSFRTFSLGSTDQMSSFGMLVGDLHGRIRGTMISLVSDNVDSMEDM